MKLLVLILATGVALALPDPAAAQGPGHAKGRGKRVEVHRAADVWRTAPGRRVANGRDSDSDSDSDSDDRGGYWDRGRDGPYERCEDVAYRLERQHDQWHRENDRHRGTRGWERAHDNLHDRIERQLEREGCDPRRNSSRGSVLEDIIFGPDRDSRDRDRLPRPDGRDRDREGRGTILGRIPVPRGSVSSQERVNVSRLGEALDALLGGGR